MSMKLDIVRRGRVDGREWVVIYINNLRLTTHPKRLKDEYRNTYISSNFGTRRPEEAYFELDKPLIGQELYMIEDIVDKRIK